MKLILYMFILTIFLLILNLAELTAISWVKVFMPIWFPTIILFILIMLSRMRSREKEIYNSKN